MGRFARLSVSGSGMCFGGFWNATPETLKASSGLVGGRKPWAIWLTAPKSPATPFMIYDLVVIVTFTDRSLSVIEG